MFLAASEQLTAQQSKDDTLPTTYKGSRAHLLYNSSVSALHISSLEYLILYSKFEPLSAVALKLNSTNHARTGQYSGRVAEIDHLLITVQY